MALGDKLPVVMGKEKAAANGVATLGADGKLAEEQRPTPTEAGAADLTLSNLSNRQKALRNIGGRPNQNLLDNAHCVGGGSQQGGGQLPINQRGELVYHGPAYGIDRWVIQQGVTLTVNADGITIQNTGSQEAQFSQTLELTKFYPGASYTASALVNSVTGNASIYLQENGGDFSTIFNFALHDGLNYGSGILNEADFENNLRFIFAIGAGASVKLFSSKLEPGPTQTLAYQDEDGNWQLFETPDYAEELAKCQRYFVRESFGGNTMYCQAEPALYGGVKFPKEMRTMPAVSNVACRDIFTGGSISGLVASLIDAHGFNAVVGLTGTIGHVYEISYEASAEL